MDAYAEAMTTDELAASLPWRAGRRLIYAQRGPVPSRRDPVIAMLGTPELAAVAVVRHNALLARELGEGALPEAVPA